MPTIKLGEIIQINGINYKCLSVQLGSNPGGFFSSEAGEEYYIKYTANTEQHKIDNEVLALQLYKLYGVATPEVSKGIFTFKGEEYSAIVTKKSEIAPLKKNMDKLQDDQFLYYAHQDFLIHALLCNWDVVGLEYDNLFITPDSRPFVLDTGGCLFYRARGEPKGQAFNPQATEFETMVDPKHIQSASVFRGVYNSTALVDSYLKLCSISDEQLRKHVYAYGFAQDSENEKLIKLLLARKQALLQKALSKIADTFIDQHLKTRCADDGVDYLLQYKDNASAMLNRVKHGGMHASRVVLFALELVKMLQEKGYKPAQELTERQLLLLTLVCLAHDSGRRHDAGGDKEEWEHDGAAKCREYLAKCGNFTKEEVYDCFAAVAGKDNPKVQESNVFALILGIADSIDYVRSHGSDLDLRYTPKIFQDLFSKDEQEQFALKAKKLAVFQGDSPRTQTIAGETIKGNFDILRKEQYEHASTGTFKSTEVAWQQITKPKSAKANSSVLETVNISKEQATLNKLTKALITLSSKSHLLHEKSLKNPKYKAAAATANTLVDSLNDLLNDYTVGPKNAKTYTAFKTKALKAITTARPVLEKHRGWKEALGNAILAILGVGIIYGIAICVNRIVTGKNWLFFKTDSEDKLDKFEQSVKLAQPGRR